MKVLLINGSPRNNGGTANTLEEMSIVFSENNIDSDIVQITKNIKGGCIACDKCKTLKKCVFDDIVNTLADKVDEYDGLVVASPVYYSSMNGTVSSFLDRFFRITSTKWNFKVGAGVAVLRRCGGMSTIDEINRYFLLSSMVVVGSSYWNDMHGNNKDEISKDEEGLQTIRQLAENMSYVIKSLKSSKEIKPEIKKLVRTNFIK